MKDLGSNYPNSVKFTVAHKRYVLVTKIVDILIESMAHKDGIDLYKKGANIAYSNMLFYIIRTLVSEDFFNDMIFNFQEMIRTRTVESYDSFFKPLFDNQFPEEVDELLSLLQAFHIRFGYPFLQTLPADVLDIALTEALTLMNEWKINIPESENIILIHDQSSNMAKEKEFWDKLVSPNAPPKTVGYDRRKMSYPIRIEETEFANSRDYAGLQIADILAGAITRYFKWIINGKDENDVYGKKLVSNMPEAFGAHMIWPSPHVTPDELGTNGNDADDPIDYVLKIRRDT